MKSIIVTPYSEKSNEGGLLKVSGKEVFHYGISRKDLQEVGIGTGSGVSVPFMISPNQLIIPQSHEGRFGWLREYSGFGNNVRANAMKVLATSSGEEVMGNDGYGGIFIIDGGSNIDELMSAWRGVNAKDISIFDARTGANKSCGTDFNITRVIQAYKDLMEHSDKIK